MLNLCFRLNVVAKAEVSLPWDHTFTTTNVPEIMALRSLGITSMSGWILRTPSPSTWPTLLKKCNILSRRTYPVASVGQRTVGHLAGASIIFHIVHVYLRYEHIISLKTAVFWDVLLCCLVGNY